MKLMLAMLFATASVIAGPGDEPSPPPPPPTIKIGLIVSTSGAIATFGQDNKDGVDLAVKEINAAGGIDGQNIEIVFVDGASKPEEAGTAARHLISTSRVVACIGCVASALTLNAAPVFQNAKIPLISPSATNPTVTQQGDMIFRACFLDDFQAEACAFYAWNDMKAKTAAILSNKDDPYSTGLAKRFKEHFVALGGKTVAEETFGRGASDFEPQLGNIEKAAPDVLFAPVYYNDMALIAKQAVAAEIKANLLGGDGWESASLITNAGEAIEGGVFADHYCAVRDDKSKAFAKAYKDEYDETPSSLAALGYDTVYMLVQAIKDAGSSDGTKIAAALAKLKDFDGVTGDKVRMGQDRNPEKPLFMVTIEEGEFALARELTYEEVRPPEKK